MTDDPQRPGGADEENPLAMLADEDPRGGRPPASKQPAKKATTAPASKQPAKKATKKAARSQQGGARPRSGPSSTGQTAAPARPPVGGEGSPTEASLVGIVMIVIAVLIGAFLLAKGYETEGDLVAGTSPTTVSADGGPTPTGLTTTSTTAPPATTEPLRPPADVLVRVANGGGEEGVALQGTNKLETAGYQTTVAVDAPAQDESTVYYVAGFEGEAVEVAKVFDIPESNVSEMPASPPVDPGGADVLVVLGPEQKLN